LGQVLGVVAHEEPTEEVLEVEVHVVERQVEVVQVAIKKKKK
jgi:hypothetical protein